MGARPPNQAWPKNDAAQLVWVLTRVRLASDRRRPRKPNGRVAARGPGWAGLE